METKLKLGITAGIALLLIGCGSGTAVPKKKPVDYKTPSPTPSVTTVPGERCSKKGATITIKGQKYVCKQTSSKDKTLRWRR